MIGKEMNYLTPSLVAAVVLALLCALLLAAVWNDVKSHLIPNWIVFFGAGAGLLLNSVLPEGYGFISVLPGALGFWKALAGLSLGLAIMLPLHMLRAMGAGDVKLVAMVGAFLGPNAVIGTILITFVIGGVMAVVVVLRNGTLGLLINNLYSMLLGSFIRTTVLHEMPTIDAASVSAGKLPYGVAITLGTFTYMALEHGGHMYLLKFF